MEPEAALECCKHGKGDGWPHGFATASVHVRETTQGPVDALVVIVGQRCWPTLNDVPCTHGSKVLPHDSYGDRLEGPGSVTKDRVIGGRVGGRPQCKGVQHGKGGRQAGILGNGENVTEEVELAKARSVA